MNATTFTANSRNTPAIWEELTYESNRTDMTMKFHA